MKDAKEFLSALFEHATRNCVVSYANSDAKTFKPVEKYGLTGAQIIKFIETYDVPGRAVYACVSDVPAGKRSKQNVGGTFAAFADLDFKGIAHPRAAIDEAIELLPLPPTFVIFTGNGLHLWWIFVEPVADHERVERLLKNISHVLAGDPAVCEVSRVMRIPSSHNTKNGANALVKIEQGRTDRYTIEQLEEYFEFAMPLLHRVERVDQTKREPVKLDLYQQFVKLNSVYKPGTFKGQDNEALWSEMRFPGNVYVTTRDVLNSMLGSGVPVNDALDEIQRQCIERIPEAAAWDWDDPTLGMPQHMEKAISFLAKALDALEKQEDPPAWLEKDARIKRARKQIKELAAAEPHAPGNGALNGSAKLNGSTPHAPENNAPAASVEGPVDLWAFREPAPLPHGVLPPAIDIFAREKSRQTGLDLNGLAMGALIACAAVIPNSIRLQPGDNEKFTQPPILWCVMLGGVGAAKTGILDETMDEIRKIQSRLTKEYKEAMAEWSKLDREEKKDTPKPPRTCLSLSDVTVERLGEIAEASPDGLIIENDELAGWFGGMEKYSGKSGGSGVDRKNWLQFHNCGILSVERMSRSVYADPFGGCVVGGMQPNVIQQLNESGTNDGLLQRFLPVSLKKRVIGQKISLSPETKDFDALIRRLRDMPRVSFGNLKFSAKAEREWQRIDARVLDIAESYSYQNAQLASHLNKYGAMILRTALVFHCIENGHQATRMDIDVDVLLRAERFFFDFLIDHARAVYFDTLNQADSADRLLKVADYLLAHPKVMELTPREIQNGTHSLRKLGRSDANMIFDYLHSYGWLNKSYVKKSGSPPTWPVNPQIHDGRFAARAAEVQAMNVKYTEEINRAKLRKAESSHANT